MLFEQPERSFASIAHVDSNLDAVDAALNFSARKIPFVAIIGPSGWGKTHLLHAVSRSLGFDSNQVFAPISVDDFWSTPQRSESAPLILDNIQEVLAKPRQRMAVRIALERRIRIGRPAILSFTASQFSREIKAFLPIAREWTTAVIREPDIAERVVILEKMVQAEGLTFSPNLTNILVRELKGTASTYSGVLKRLRLSGLVWVNPGQILRALGLLDAFFVDNSAWDLKLKILKVEERCRAAFPLVNVRDLAIYTMVTTAELGEAGVARLTSMSPSSVFELVNQFNNSMRNDPTLVAHSQKFAECVVASFVRD